MKPLLFIFGVLATLTPIKTDSPKERKVDVGSEVKIPCKLKGTKVSWYWIPRYPVCLGIKGDNMAIEIFYVISNRSHTNERFCGRLSQESKEEKRTAVTLKHLYMNDSGVFYCSNGSKESTRISVTVKPGYQNGISHNFSEEKKSSIITITCNKCKNKMEKGINEDDTIITWTLNGNAFSKEHISSGTRNSLRLRRPFKRHFGLWKCTRSGCLTEFDGYCLGNDSETSKNSDDVETLTASPADPDEKKHSDPYVIGGSIAGVLILFLICIIIFIICRRSRSHSVSEITRKPEKQECKEVTGSEGPPKKREEREPRSEDYTSREGAAESIQYSTLEFKEAGQQQSKINNEVSSVIYAQMPTGH